MSKLNLILSEGYPVLLFVKLFLGAVAVFFAVIVWSRTKRLSMIFFIFGIFFMYISILTEALNYFGFIDTNIFNIGKVPTISVFLEAIPIIFFIVSFCASLRERLF